LKAEYAIGVSGLGTAAEPYRGVVVCRLGDRVEVAVRRRVEPGSGSLTELVADLTAKARAASRTDDPQAAVAGVYVASGSSLAMYRLEVPAVKNSQLASIVRMQVEAKLPLASDQMRLAWRGDGATTGNTRICTVVAGRASRYDECLGAAQKAGLNRVIPDWEAIARAWGLMGDGNGRDLLLVVRKSNSQALLVEDGRLIDAVSLDVGQDDFAAESDGVGSERLELFSHDLWNTMGRFEARDNPEIRVMTRGNGTSVEEYLKRNGIAARPAQASVAAAAGAVDTDEDPQDFLEAVGGAILAMESPDESLDLLFDHPDMRPKKKPIVSLSTVLALAATILALIVFLLVARHLDQSAVEKLQDDKIAQLVKVQDLRKAIAVERPDMLDLMTKINESLLEGMLLENFSFQKGKPISIASSAASYDQVLKFKTSLESKAGISNVKILDPTLDDRRGRYNFKMSFEYMHFNKASKR
jgi:Tfp pilus assembly protein PilN